MINYVYLFIFFLNFLWSLSLTPYVALSYDSDTDLYEFSNANFSKYIVGLNISHISNKINIESNISYHLYDYLNRLPNQFNPSPGLGTIENSPGLQADQFNFFYSDIMISYLGNKGKVYIGKSNPIWGVGESKIFLSDKAPPFFNLGYQIKINDKIYYEHLHGSLDSRIPNSTIANSLYDFDSYDVFPQYPRSIAAHRLEISFNQKAKLTILEIIVYGGHRSIEPYYLLPFVPFLPIQTYLGDVDNDMIGFYFMYNFSDNFNVYSSLLIDEWSPPYTFKKNNKNWAIYKIGLLSNIFSNNDEFGIEYIYSDNRVFKHRFEINDFYSFNYPVGFWAGPHSDEIFVKYKFNYKNLDFLISYSNARRGKLDDEVVLGKYQGEFYNQFSGVVEKKKIISCSVKFKFNEKYDFAVGYDMINWENAGFDPLYPNDSMLIDLKKNNYFFEFNYNIMKINL